MPNILSSAWNAANQSLVPEAPVRKLQEQMTEPHLDESPLWAQVKGFGAGALEGLRNQLTPMNLAGLAAGPIGKIVAPAAEAAEGIGAVARPTIDLIESSPWQSAKQVAPAADDVDALIGGPKSSLAKTPNAGAANAMKGLQTVAPAAEFAPVGGERAYNAVRPAAAAFPDPTESAYQRILQQLPQQTGAVNTDAVAGAGALGGLAYGGYKLYNSLKGKADEMRQKLDPFQRYNNVLNPPTPPK